MSLIFLVIGVAACSHPVDVPNPGVKQGSGSHSYDGLALARDGSALAYLDDDQVRIQKLSDAQTASYQLCTTENCDITDFRWSHHGQKLAAITTDGTKSTVILLVGQARNSFDVQGLVSAVMWSPDDQSLALLATLNPQKNLGATSPGRSHSGEYSDSDEQRLAITSVTGTNHAVSYISPANVYVYEAAWTPDGKGLVAASVLGNGDANWWNASVNYYGVDKTQRKIVQPEKQIRYPVVAPDGKSVAFIGGLMSDYLAPGGDIYVVPFAGGQAHNITTDAHETYTSLEWNSTGLMANAINGFDQNLVKFQLNGNGKASESIAWHTQETRGTIEASDNNEMIASIRYGFTKPPTIYAGEPGHVKPVLSGTSWQKSHVHYQKISWKNDGYELTGWLLSSAHPSGGKHPLIVDVHGGPAAEQPVYFMSDTQQTTNQKLLDKGYYIFLPNPRGSYGHGEKFVQANYKDFGGGDFRDIMAGIEQVEKLAPIDDHLLAMKGTSYGGFMAMWAATHTDKFKAIIAGAGTSDWISYYGENGINGWLVPYFGATVYDDPDIYRKLSPLASIKQAKTPTLLWVGEYDIECPPGQSEEFYQGLRAMKVPTKLFIYPDEGHGLSAPQNIKDEQYQEISWLKNYLR